MLQAKTKEGKLITLASLTKTEITEKRMQDFFCPACHEQVIVRAGPQTIPHFAHKSTSPCPNGAGGESSYHEKGKFLIYRWLKHQGLKAELEHSLPHLQQRPDVYLTISSKRIAIEYQCSRIPIETINKRNNGYLKAGITPIWILSAKLFNRKGLHRLKVDTFLRHFIHHFSTRTVPVLYFFCPDTQQLSRFQHIYDTRPNQALGRIDVSPLKKRTFPDLFVHHPDTKTWFYNAWKHEKKVFRVHQKTSLHGRELDWYRWLYEKRMHKEYLPSIIYVPVRGGHIMKTSTWDWQSRICLDIIHPLAIGDMFTAQDCSRLLNRFIDKANNYPLIRPHANPITTYLNFLDKEGTLEQIAPHMYKKIRPIQVYATLEKAIKGDGQFMDRLGKKQK